MNRVAKVKLRESGDYREINITSLNKPEISDVILEKWQSILNLMAKIMDVPAGLIMKLHDDKIEIFLKNTNRDNPYEAGKKETLGLGLYCESVVGQNQLLHLPNALKHDKWADNPDAKVNMISYLGMPIQWPDNEIFGTICVLDSKENQYHNDMIELMSLMKSSIEDDLNIMLTNVFLRKLSITDPLTNLYNRIELTKSLNQFYELFKRYNIPFSILILDIDNFKKINDTHGHLIGDEILQRFSQILMSNIRKTDVLGRWGGEEFLIVCPETELQSSQKLASKLLEFVREHSFPESIKITASIGLATTNSDLKDYNELIKAADEALYLSKAEGKNRMIWK